MLVNNFCLSNNSFRFKNECSKKGYRKPIVLKQPVTSMLLWHCVHWLCYLKLFKGIAFKNQLTVFIIRLLMLFNNFFVLFFFPMPGFV